MSSAWQEHPILEICIEHANKDVKEAAKITGVEFRRKIWFTFIIWKVSPC